MFTRNKVLFFTEMGNVDEKWGILSYLVDWAFFGLLGLGGEIGRENSDLKSSKQVFFRIISCCYVNVHKLLYQ